MQSIRHPPRQKKQDNHNHFLFQKGIHP
jgi:hypothetical protein